MKPTRFLTLKYIAELLKRPLEDVALAAMQDPAIKPSATADGTRIYDRESADIIAARLDKMDVDAERRADNE